MWVHGRGLRVISPTVPLPVDRSAERVIVIIIYLFKVDGIQTGAIQTVFKFGIQTGAIDREETLSVYWSNV